MADRQAVLDAVEEACQAGARQAQAAEVAGVSVRTLQRWRQAPEGDQRRGPHSSPSHALSDEERAHVLEVANRPEFRELSPKQIVPKLADRGEYIASESTFYRILRSAGQLTHRRAARPARHSTPPPLRAIGPNQVYSWDITYLKSPVRGLFFFLYLFVDIWSRKIVGWRVEEQESSELAAQLAVQIFEAEGLEPGQVRLHADNGGPMKGATMLATLQQLGMAASFSRPRVSNDNPYSEALFRTAKYRPSYPSRPFETLEHARLWVDRFVRWYNTEHLHSALNFVTPDSRHRGHDPAILAQRAHVYDRAKQAHPQRWSGARRNWSPAGDVVLNGRRPPVESESPRQAA